MTSETRWTDTTPVPNGYGVRACRGHWHVYITDENGDESADIAIPGDPFKTREEAVAGLFAYMDERSRPSPIEQGGEATTDERPLDVLRRVVEMDAVREAKNAATALRAAATPTEETPE